MTSSARCITIKCGFFSRATILDVAGFVPNDVIDNFEALSKTGMINSHTAIVEAIRNGYSARQILMQFSDRLLRSKEYDQVQKVGGTSIQRSNVVTSLSRPRSSRPWQKSMET